MISVGKSLPWVRGTIEAFYTYMNTDAAASPLARLQSEQQAVEPRALFPDT